MALLALDRRKEVLHLPLQKQLGALEVSGAKTIYETIYTKF